MKPLTIAVVAGARPIFMKIGPNVRALRERAGAITSFPFTCWTPTSPLTSAMGLSR
jgi:hypothetical protein